MSVWLDTRGKSTLAIGICGRCSRKFSMTELMPDPNYPGLLVCKDDKDDYDPYRLAPRAPDNITLQFVRPDTPLTDGYTAYIIETDYLLDEDGDILLDENGDPLEAG